MMRRLIVWMVTGLMTIGGNGYAAGAVDDRVVDVEKEAFWVKADEAYGGSDTATGNQYMKKLMDRYPGDTKLAVRCLERMLAETDRYGFRRYHVRAGYWAKYCSRRLMALEQGGYVSARTRAVRTAAWVNAAVGIQEGRLIEAVAEMDRLVKENPQDLYYRLMRARVYRLLGFSETGMMFTALRKELDINHPDERIRELSQLYQAEFSVDVNQLPKAILPLPKGSPIVLMAPDDPEGLWQMVLNQGPTKHARVADRLYAKAVSGEDIVPWLDNSGLTFPQRVLELHLGSLPKGELKALRELQTRRFDLEYGDLGSGENEVVRFGRRYAWAKQTTKLLLGHANRALWAGHARAALRSYEEVMKRTEDDASRRRAQVGYWTALAQLSDRGELLNAFEGFEGKGKFPWKGKMVGVEVIKKALVRPAGEVTVGKGPSLEEVAWQVIRIPPVSPWSLASQTSTGALDLQVDGDDLLVSSRNLMVMYDAKKAGAPRWRQIHQHHLDSQHYRDFYPGYFRPAMTGEVLYARWGYTSYPRGFAAIDRKTGRSLWTNEKPYPNYNSRRERMFHVPVGDVRIEGGLMYYLEWSNRHDLRRNVGRRLSVVCYDPAKRAELWRGVIVEAGQASDLNRRFERSRYQTAIYGNKVTLDGGAIYSCSNAGIVARSDVRDGQMEWVHYYGWRGSAGTSSVGAAPIVKDGRVIFMPRDSSRVFALDTETGRVVWENVLVRPLESLGLKGELLVLRGETSLVGLEHKTGKIRWHVALGEPALARAQLIGDSVYVGSASGLARYGVKTGQLVERMDWPTKKESVMGFRIAGGRGYLVTDLPGEDERQPAGVALNPDASGKGTAFGVSMKRSWSLPRHEARVVVPPRSSGIKGRGFVLSDGMLECLKLTAKGGITWRRFARFRDAQFHFYGGSVILYERNRRVTPSVKSRVAMFDLGSGRVKWRANLSVRLNQVQQVGKVMVFGDGQGRYAGVESSTGKLLWERQASVGAGSGMHGVGATLHAFHTSLYRAPRHVMMDVATGEVKKVQGVSLDPIAGMVHARSVTGGYLEVRMKEVKVRYVRLEAVSEVNGMGWASCAELQVIGEDLKNLNRDAWKVTASNWEKKANAGPMNVVDGDRTSWWHSEWKDHIPRHPHSLYVDMGKSQVVKGIRYLPAKIINSNGTIKDYRLYVSEDGKKWGQPVASGMLVARVRVHNPRFAGKSVFFESHDQRTRTNNVYRYGLETGRSALVYQDARIMAVKGRYVVVSKHNRPKPESMVVLDGDDEKYAMEISPRVHFNPARGFYIRDGRMVISERGLMVVDLKKKKVLVPYLNNNRDQNRHGTSMLVGKDHLLKVIHGGGHGQYLYLIDLRDGKVTSSRWKSQTEPLRDVVNQHATEKVQEAEETLIVYDGWNVQGLVGEGAGDGE